MFTGKETLMFTGKRTWMFTRVLMTGVVGVGLVAGLGGEAEGHLAGYAPVNGYLKHVSSFVCGINIKGVANLEQHPALFRCTAVVTRVEILCENPANHKVSPGEAATQTVFIVEGTVTTGNITDKKKGKANKEVLIEDNVLLNPEFCVNPNWFPLDVLSINVSVRYDTFECTDDLCTGLIPAYTEEQECVLPGFNRQGEPPAPGTLYACTVTSSTHWK